MRCDAWCFHISFLQAIYAEDDPLVTSSPRRAGDDEEEVEEMEEVDEAPPAAHAASASGNDMTRVLHERYTAATGIATAAAEAEVAGSHARRSRVGTMDAAAEAEGDAAEAEAEAEAAAQQATSELAEIALERLVAAATSPKRKRLARPVWNGGAVTAEAAARSLGANSGLHASNEASSVGSSDEQELAIPPATPPQNSAGTSTASWRAFLATLDAEGQQIAAQVAEDVAAQESEQQQQQQQLQLGGESGDKSASPRKGRMSTGAGQPPVPSSLIAQRRRRLARSSQANARRRRVVPVNSSHLPQLPKRRTLSAASRRTYTKRLRDRAKNESVSSSACW